MINEWIPRIHSGRQCPRTGTMGSCDVLWWSAGKTGRIDATRVMPLPIKRLLHSMRGFSAPLMLAVARGRRRPARWLLPALGIALAAAFGAGVAAESAIAGDQSARSVLDSTSPLDSEVRVTWQGAVGPGVADQARALLSGLGLGTQTEVVLMNPVRLGGVVVRPAAIAPLGRWLPSPAPLALRRLALRRAGWGPAARSAARCCSSAAVRSLRRWPRSASVSRSSARPRCARRSRSGSYRPARVPRRCW